jgi:hypothetical protein
MRLHGWYSDKDLEGDSHVLFQGTVPSVPWRWMDGLADCLFLWMVKCRFCQEKVVETCLWWCIFASAGGATRLPAYGQSVPSLSWRDKCERNKNLTLGRNTGAREQVLHFSALFAASFRPHLHEDRAGAEHGGKFTERVSDTEAEFHFEVKCRKDVEGKGGRSKNCLVLKT